MVPSVAPPRLVPAIATYFLIYHFLTFDFLTFPRQSPVALTVSRGLTPNQPANHATNRRYKWPPLRIEAHVRQKARRHKATRLTRAPEILTIV
ncbi:hypothetical protein Rcae01_00786 [Novipirellula caenicola]|uniref:Secreted protein n=1 Tax=Novipirellula caenicola TaxID=1536901 RepID=A0ABP9VNN6_9BACT